MFQFSDPSKKMLHKFLRMHSPVKTLTNLRVDWSWSVTKSMTKLKAHPSNSKFFCLLEVSRIDRFPFSKAVEAPPHVHVEAPLKNPGCR